MKAKRLKRRSAEETPRKSFVVSGSAVAPALYKAKIPTRFVRPNVSLGDFEWGERMSSWIDGSLPECSEKGRGAYISGPAEEGLDACAMLVRTLVLRGKDAVFTTLMDLMEGERPRVSDYLVVAGFYDEAFDRDRGCPMDTKEAYKLSWMLWRLANEGTTLVVHTTPSPSSAGKWWLLGALTSIFDKDENFYTDKVKTPNASSCK